jgi:hypothetical protein
MVRRVSRKRQGYVGATCASSYCGDYRLHVRPRTAKAKCLLVISGGFVITSETLLLQLEGIPLLVM